MTKLFGLSASGFNAGEDDLEQYNQMVEGDVRAHMDSQIDKVFTVIMAHLFGYIPEFTFDWQPLRVLKASEEESIKTSKQARYTQLFELGVIDAYELAQILDTEKLLPIEIKASKGIISPNPMDKTETGTLPKTPKPASARGVSGKG